MTKAFTSDKPTLAEIRRRKKPAEQSTDLCIDPVLVRRYQEITNEIDHIRRRARSRTATEGGLSDDTQRQIDNLTAQLAPLEEEIEAATVTFIARDPGRKKFEDLVTKHRPTDDQKKDWKESGMLQREGPLQWNQETFIPALMALCFVQPEMTEQEADEICDEWGNGEVAKLFNTALFVCNEVTTIPKFKSGTEATSSTALNSTTALNGESPTPDS